MTLVWPGAGQFLQKRWLVGSLYAVAFLMFVVLAFAYGVRILTAWYGLVDGSTVDTNSIRIYAWKMLVFLAISILVWIVSVIDLYVAHFRRCNERLRKQLAIDAGVDRVDGPARD